MKSLKYIKEILLVILCLSFLLLCKQLYNMGKEINRLSDNQTAIFTGVKHSQDSLMATVQRVELTTDELKTKYPSIKQDLKELGLRIGQVESVTKTGLKIQANLVAGVKDSIVKGDTLMKQYYADKFVTISSLLNRKQDTAFIKVEMPVNLDQVVSRYKDGFFLWKPFKRWKYKQTIKSDNPYAKITYNEYITIKR